MKFFAIPLLLISLSSFAQDQDEFPEKDQVKKLAGDCLLANKHVPSANLNYAAKNALTGLDTLKGEQINIMKLQDGITVIYQVDDAKKPVILSIEGKSFYMSSDIRSVKDCTYEESNKLQSK